MDKQRCKYHNGDWHNETCKAGVRYRDVTPDPDDHMGIAYRKPCIINSPVQIEQMNDGQRANYERRGTCEKFTLPTRKELRDDKRRWGARIKKVLSSIEKGVVPDGVFVCGPGTVGKCDCKCPESCGHVWNGEPVKDEGMETATCSVCGKWQINHDMWVME